MSRRRKQQQEEENDRVGKTYDDFAEHVRRHMKDRKNPDICVAPFEQMPNKSVTHIELVLEQVKNGHIGLFQSVESFAPGAELKTREDIVTGTPVYVAYIPYVKSREKKTHKDYDEDDDEPSTAKPKFLVFLLMCVIIVSLATTSTAQLRYITGH